MPVDFKKLRSRKKRQRVIDPLEIFRRLPKAPGINDLYTSQAQVLDEWFKRRNDRDIVVKLHTGGGKTLVGLLMAQSTLNEMRAPVLYLVPTVQLVQQAMEQAKSYGVPAVAYQSGQPLADEFLNSNAVMIATYKALFHGKSKFGVRGAGQPVEVGAVLLDDAHVAFPVVRDSFTLTVESKKNRALYDELTGLFRKAFRDIDRLGTFDDMVSGREFGVIEVPYWAWSERLDVVREHLKSAASDYALVWPLLRDHLHLCHALISRAAFTITPILPIVDLFPTFSEAPRRIYMSATIADDSEIVRTFDADKDAVSKPLISRSLAGVSERMVLIPDLMPFEFDVRDAMEKLLPWLPEKHQKGALLLVPSNKAAEEWSDVCDVAKGSRAVEAVVARLRTMETLGPVVLANRYDGIDLPGDACRLLVMFGLPKGTTDYEIFRGSALYGGSTITRALAQRVEQGIGRGARGAGDHCVVLLAGADLSGWIAKDANFRFLTSATKAQFDMGAEISKEVETLEDLARTMLLCINRDEDWMEYHAETLAELVDGPEPAAQHLDRAAKERKSFNLWRDGYHEKAVARLDRAVGDLAKEDVQAAGWIQQLAARVADNWGQTDRAEDLQRQAYAKNRNLLRPKVLPPYRPMVTPSSQASAIVRQLGGYRVRRGLIQSFEEVASHLHANASANQFEQALVDLANMVGLAAERFDDHGEGPDVLWLLPGKVGLVIEAKSRKKESNPLTKDEHGQLLVAAEWFAENYPEHACVRVSVHPTNRATPAAQAGGSYALTLENLVRLLADARSVLTALANSQLAEAQLEAECSTLLAGSSVRADRIVASYLVPFEE